MNPQQPPNQPGGWSTQPGGLGVPRRRGIEIPPLPAALSLLVVIGLIGMFVGTANAFGGTSTEELCAAYNTLRSSFSNDHTDDVTDEIDHLASLAADYDEEGVRSDAESLDNLGMLVYESDLSSATSNIRAECN